jgi:pimeloyl-ACP methyl ester carboxylesterase
MAAPNLLILPGLLCDARAFQAQVAGLKHHANCVVADLSAADSIVGMAASSLRRVPPGPLAVAGHSMGGYVALEIARQVPDRVVGLALLNTNARPDSEQSTEDRRRMMKLAETDFERVVNALLPKLLHADHMRDAAMVATIKAMAAAVGKDGYVRSQTAIINRIDSRPHLGKIRCPTLVVAGRDDAIMPLAVLEELANGITGSRLVVAEKCGHMATLEQSQMVTMNLVHWLSGLR